MSSSGPDEDFDDGGTPSWRRHQANQAAYRNRNAPSIAGIWRRASPMQIFVAVFSLALAVPVLVAVGGFLAAFAWSQIAG